jgi:hypothetical protein
MSVAPEFFAQMGEAYAVGAKEKRVIARLLLAAGFCIATEKPSPDRAGVPRSGK